MKYALIGAELQGQDVYCNYDRTRELRQELVNRGLAFVGVSNVSAKGKAQLFLVTTGDEDVIITLAKLFGQKVILISDEKNNVEVVRIKDGSRTFLGKLEAVSKAAAKDSKFHITFEENGTTYFYVTNKGLNCDKTNGTSTAITY